MRYVNYYQLYDKLKIKIVFLICWKNDLNKSYFH